MPLSDALGIEHQQAVGKHRRHTEIMSYEQNGGPGRASNVSEQAEDLRLGQTSSAVVGSSAIRSFGCAIIDDGNQHPLALPAGETMRQASAMRSGSPIPVAQPVADRGVIRAGGSRIACGSSWWGSCRHRFAMARSDAGARNRRPSVPRRRLRHPRADRSGHLGRLSSRQQAFAAPTRWLISQAAFADQRDDLAGCASKLIFWRTQGA